VRSRKRTFGKLRAISGVRSVENESSTTISSHHARLSRQARMWRSSSKQVTTPLTGGRAVGMAAQGIAQWPFGV
jgi:hypothetical protein